MTKIKIGILGYGKLGKSVEENIKYHKDMDLVGIFSRRGPGSVHTQTPAYHIDDLEDFKEDIDVLILCGGSKNDIPVLGPKFAKDFSTVDVYDNHNDIDGYFDKMDAITRQNETTSIVATGWDPGLFSLMRILSDSIVPQGQTYTFWGRGLSQGHSDAVRSLDGVQDAVQYTIPKEEMIGQIKAYEDVDYDQKDAHLRQVYVVAEPGADKSAIEDQIVNMKDYFLGYTTQVVFIDQETMDKDHKNLPHGGHIIRRGLVGDQAQAIMELYLDLTSNPDFTAAVALAYARACYRLNQMGKYGAHTVGDVAPNLLSQRPKKEIRQTMI